MTKILVIDDDQQVADSIKRVLEKRFPGCTVSVAYKGMAAMRSMADAGGMNAFAVVILDIRLPDIDGNDLAEAMHTNHFAGQLIGITGASADDERLVRAHQLCTDHVMEDVIEKPFDFEALVARIADRNEKN